MFSDIFPPFRLLQRILCKITDNGSKTILIAPALPSNLSFPISSYCRVRNRLVFLWEGTVFSIQEKEASRNGETPSARMVAERTSIRQRGFFWKKASTSLEQLYSQQVQYMTQDDQSFCSWCLSEQIEPLSVTAQQLSYICVPFWRRKLCTFHH